MARTLLAVVGGSRQRHLGGGFPLGGRATQKRTWGGEDPGGLGAHTQDSPAARRQDLEVELVEAHAEFVSGSSKSFFHGLAREFAVCVAEGSHVSVVSLYGSCACACWAGQLRPPMPIAPPACTG